DRPKKKAAKSGKGLLILGGVAGGVILIVGIILLLTLGGGEPTKSAGGPKSGGARSTDTPTPKADDPWADLDDPAKADAAADKIWTLLQNDDSALDKLRDKILAGNAAAHSILKKAAESATKAELQSKAKQMLADIQKQLAGDSGDPKNDPTNFLPNNTQV